MEGSAEDLERCYPQVRRLCRRLLRTREEADEVTQIVMLRLHANRDQFNGRATYATWVYGATLNAVRTYRRDQEYDRLVQPAESGLLEDVPDDLSLPPEAVSTNELRQAVRTALDRLPAEYREALLLRNLERLSYGGIADVLGCALGTVKSRLHNGTVLLGKELRRLLGRDAP